MIKLAGSNKHRLPAKSIEIAKEKLKSSNTKSLVDKIELTEALFLKAPSHFLEKTSSDDQVLIVEQVYSHLETFIKDEPLLLVNSFPIPNHKGLIGMAFILKDRQFIVDTISNYFKNLGIFPFCLLHPILNINDSYKISLTYIEIELNSNLKLDNVVADLNSLLNLLCSSTDSYPAMIQVVKNFSNLIEIQHPGDQGKEITSFLSWLLNGRFVFLGTWNIKSNESLGILSKDNKFESENNLKLQLNENLEVMKNVGLEIIFTKLKSRSPIHRNDYLEAINITLGAGETLSIVGLFTSRVWKQEVSEIPILRHKLSNILIEEGLVPSSHDYKELISLADTVPKSDFFQYSEDQIKTYFNTIMHADIHEVLRLIQLADKYKRLMYITTALPKDRYSPNTVDQIEEILSTKLEICRNAIESYSVLGDHSLVLIRSAIPYNEKAFVAGFLTELEATISRETANWNDSLRTLLSENLDEEKATSLFNHFRKAFKQAYKATHSPEVALKDILIVDNLSSEHQLDLSLELIEPYRNNPSYKLTIYKRGEDLLLSDIVPFLENLGLEVISEVVYPVSENETKWGEIYDILVSPKSGVAIKPDIIEENIVPALKLILSKKLENDSLNKLLINPSLTPKEISLCRALARYLLQIKVAVSLESVTSAFTTNSDSTALIVKFFQLKFNPRSNFSEADRKFEIEKVKEELFATLKKITDSSHDKIIRTTIYLVEAILRTNYYISEHSFRLSFKIDCSLIKLMPQPVPFREIFVSAPNFQGTHLRGGKVARGGLRWSSRKDDFRTEVLGLMKTQMVKNAIIVPVGAKGGFILHDEPKERAALLQAVESTYKEFIRSLLDITDNRIGSETIHPNNVICYDEFDPYFVVAADRGTATFSDIANGIARNEFNFWLDDAFASGGSAGYDHKALGITAKGAWECTIRHFKELGIDLDTTPFSVIGIGDMSGDVFGNGLILSENAKLIAAFDHRHIFIDPNPDPKVSFNERLRLFKLPSSSWDDYSKELLSKGGAVFSRGLKDINPSPEAREIFKLTDDSYSSSDLIKNILKAPCDLLWNGGIGTYVKSSQESNTDANDRANDELRIDASELKARIVGEGGNLGFTQRARIEYSRLGGRLNTDAVDNSGGVDTSDLEVNLKLLFRKDILDGKISIKVRDQDLKACEEEVCSKVRNRNRSQSLILSLCLKDSRLNLTYYQDAMESLEKLGKLNRPLEFLPTNEEITKRKEVKAGLTRPELAVLVAYSKMHVFESILESKLVDDPYLENLLIAYFPSSLQTKYVDLIKQHPLRKEIIATQICNLFIERMGPTFVFKILEDQGSILTNTVKAFLVAESILNVSQITSELRSLDKASTSRFFLGSLFRIQTGLDAVTRWFINDESRKLPLNDLVNRFRASFDSMIDNTDQLLTGNEEAKYQDSVRELLMHSMPHELSKKLCAFQYATNYLDLIRVSENTNTDTLKVAHLNARLSSVLEISTVLDISTSLHTEDKWESKALFAINSNLRQAISRISYRLLKEYNDSSEDSIQTYLKLREELVGRYRATLKQIEGGAPSFSAIYVVGNLLRQLGKPIIS